MRTVWIILAIGAMMLLPTKVAVALDVRVPVRSTYDASQGYPLDLLKFILDKSGVQYRIVFSDVGITTQTRQVALLKKNVHINIGWYGTSAELERELVPIRYPITRGLLGYRVFIINAKDQSRFDQVNTLDDLKRFTGDQGIGWSDIPILEHSGLKQNATPYDSIFAKVNAGRSDYFSRGITEAFREVEVRKQDFPNLVVERHVLLVYKFAGFFFTNQENLELAHALENGFRKSYGDGSFLKFFYGHPAIKTLLEKANIDGRRRIEIPNPLLTPETLAIPEIYWHRH